MFLTMVIQNLLKMLHALHWVDVSVVHRDIFSISSVFVSIITFHSENRSSSIPGIIKTADLGILLGGDTVSISTLQSIITKLGTMLVAPSLLTISPSSNASRKRSRIEVNKFDEHSDSIVDPVLNIDNSEISSLIEISNNPSVFQFYESFFLKDKPVVLTESIMDWPALQSPTRAWANLHNIINGNNN